MADEYLAQPPPAIPYIELKWIPLHALVRISRLLDKLAGTPPIDHFLRRYGLYVDVGKMLWKSIWSQIRMHFNQRIACLDVAVNNRWSQRS